MVETVGGSHPWPDPTGCDRKNRHTLRANFNDPVDSADFRKNIAGPNGWVSPAPLESRVDSRKID